MSKYNAKQECFPFLEEPWKQVVAAFRELSKEDKAKAFPCLKGQLNKNPKKKAESGSSRPSEQ